MLREVTRAQKLGGAPPKARPGVVITESGAHLPSQCSEAHSAAPKDTCAARVALTDASSRAPEGGSTRLSPQLCQTLLRASPLQAKWLEQSPGHPGR